MGNPDLELENADTKITISNLFYRKLLSIGNKFCFFSAQGKLKGKREDTRWRFQEVPWNLHFFALPISLFISKLIVGLP